MRDAFLAFSTPLLLLLAGCSGGGGPDPVPGFECLHAPGFHPGTVRIALFTSKGEIGLALDADRAPITVCNFLRYVEENWYDGATFYRICSNFVIQGGGLGPWDWEPKPTRGGIKNEAPTSGLRNDVGTIGMARDADPDSATTEFYINLKNNTHLNPVGNSTGYAVFGNVTEGWSVVEAIARTPAAPAVPRSTPVVGPAAGGCSGYTAPGGAPVIHDVIVEG